MAHEACILSKCLDTPACLPVCRRARLHHRSDEAAEVGRAASATRARCDWCWGTLCMDGGETPQVPIHKTKPRLSSAGKVWEENPFVGKHTWNDTIVDVLPTGIW